MDIKFRSINKVELPQLLELYTYLNPEDPPLDEQTQQTVWEEILSNPKISCIVAADGDRLIASCTLIIVPNLTRASRPYGVIENVVTNPDYRHQGIGTRMLQYTLSLAWAQNCYKVMLMTGRKDESTLRFYEKAGFERGLKTAFLAKPH